MLLFRYCSWDSLGLFGLFGTVWGEGTSDRLSSSRDQADLMQSVHFFYPCTIEKIAQKTVPKKLLKDKKKETKKDKNKFHKQLLICHSNGKNLVCKLVIFYPLGYSTYI